MPDKDAVLGLFQAQYYDSVDAADMESAVLALHEDVEFNHVQVWQRTDLELGASTLRGRSAVRDFLIAARPKLAQARIRHRVRDLVLDGERGAFIAAVEGEDGNEAPFVVWFEL